MGAKKEICIGGCLVNKKLLLICGPVTSQSGYGHHSRDLFHAFNSSGKYDIKIMDVRWGDCPQNALDESKPNDKIILDSILKSAQLKKQPDIYVDVRIPNEFETFGKFNIGITAGVETTAISPKWIDGCNKMDLIMVPSEHSKSGLINTLYDKIKNAPDGTQQKIGEHKIEKPVEVLFEGADEDIYKKINVKDIDKDILDVINDNIKEDFVFLFIGQWTKGGYGEDRKDISRLIKVFIESFANKKKKPALLLKTNGATFSILDKKSILKKIIDIKDKFPSDWVLPSIHLLHGELTNEEMNSLYNHPKIKCLTSFTHGEGFGRPMLEATMTGLPVVASGWSGQLDFLNPDKSILIDGELNNIPKSVVWNDILIEESQWFTINESTAYKAFNYIFENKYDIKKKGESLMHENINKFTLKKMAESLDSIMEKCTDNMPSQVQLKLPKLKRIENYE